MLSTARLWLVAHSFLPVSYLELALNGQLDLETRENLSQSHAASKVCLCFLILRFSLHILQSLLFTINDLLVSHRLSL